MLSRDVHPVRNEDLFTDYLSHPEIKAKCEKKRIKRERRNGQEKRRKWVETKADRPIWCVRS